MPTHFLFPAPIHSLPPYSSYRPPFFSYVDNNKHFYSSPAPNKASLFHILSQESDNVNNIHLSVNNSMRMPKLCFEDANDEVGLEHPKKKARRDTKTHQHNNRSPLKSIIVSNNDDVQEKEIVASGLCFKTHKPKVQREYYYAKLSKTIFRWTCCGSQAKTHPDS